MTYPGLGRGTRAGVVALLGWQLVACGSSNSDTPQPASAGGASGNTSSSAGAGGSTASGSSGSSGASGASTNAGAGGMNANGGTSATGALDCTGTFGAPTTAIAQTAGVQLASPTLSPDQRELIYTRVENSTSLATFVHSIRGAASDAFPAATALPELDAACQPAEDRNADLSPDGLRAYIVCFMDQDPAQPTLHIADRASLQAAFVVRPKSTPIGGVSVAISRDELTLYSNGDHSMNFPPPLAYQRAATTDDFGSGAEIPEFAGAALNALEPSPDGLAFYAGYMSNLVSVTRSSTSGNFGVPNVLVMQKVTHDPTTLDDVYGSPELSQDCRSLYFVQQELSNPAINGSIWVMRR